MFGIYKSEDEGQSWNEKNNGILAYPEAVSLALDPSNSDKMFVGTMAAAGWMSDDGGQTWMQPTGLSGWIKAFAVNPDNPQIVTPALLTSQADPAQPGRRAELYPGVHIARHHPAWLYRTRTSRFGRWLSHRP